MRQLQHVEQKRVKMNPLKPLTDPFIKKKTEA